MAVGNRQHLDDLELMAMLHGRVRHDVPRRAAGHPQPLVQDATGQHESAVEEDTVLANQRLARHALHSQIDQIRHHVLESRRQHNLNHILEMVAQEPRL